MPQGRTLEVPPEKDPVLGEIPQADFASSKDVADALRRDVKVVQERLHLLYQRGLLIRVRQGHGWLYQRSC